MDGLTVPIERSESPGFKLPVPEPDDGRIELLEYLAQRYSMGPKYLSKPAPSTSALQRAARVAMRAPDHHRLQPFRFVQIEDEQRPRLATLFARDAARRGHGAEQVERARSRAFNGPALLALVARIRDGIDEVPPHEQWISVGGGLMNFLNALHLMGFAGKTLSGASVRCPDIQRAFCTDGETLVAWVVVGTPVQSARAKTPDDVSRALTSWTPV